MINNTDINKTVVSNKFSFGKNVFKYFIGYKDVKKVRPLCILLPKISQYRRDFDETKYMPFLIKENALSEKYNKIWENVRNSIKKIDGEPVYNEKYLQTKLKSYKRKINTNLTIMKYKQKILNLFTYQ